jgi:polyisoprenoid-binding protein YceI
MSRFGFLALISLSTLIAHADPGVEINVALSPAGKFTATTANVKGFAQKTGDAIVAENVLVEVNTLKTGVSLRDDHLKKRLSTDKFPIAKLIKATGKDGKGKALIEIKGMQKEVTGTYEIKGNEMIAKFPMQLKDLDIKDVRYMSIGVKDEVMVQVRLPIKQGRIPATAKAQ